jgi:hypothetical protein
VTGVALQWSINPSKESRNIVRIMTWTLRKKEIGTEEKAVKLKTGKLIFSTHGGVNLQFASQ